MGSSELHQKIQIFDQFRKRYRRCYVIWGWYKSFDTIDRLFV